MTQINVRVEDKTKRLASKTLADIGLDMSSAVNLFLKQVVVDQGLPFTPSKKDPKKIRAQWDREVAQALKSGKRYTNTKALFKDLGIE